MEALDHAVDAFIEGEPYAVGRELQDEGAKHVYRFAKYTEPPPEIGLKVGDTVHNLRSSLDHLALALAHKGAEAQGITMSPKEEAHIQFPIVTSSNDFEDQVNNRGRLKYVDPAAIHQIRSRQPFQLGTGYSQDRVWNIGELDNADKHRKLATAGCVVHGLSDIVVPPGVPHPEATIPPDGWGLGAIVVAYVFPTPHPEVDVQFSPPFSITLEEAWPPTRPIHDVLSGYIEYVNEYIAGPLADRFL